MAWHPTWNDDDGDLRGGGRFRYVNARESFRKPSTRGLWTIILICVFVFMFLQGGGRKRVPLDEFGRPDKKAMSPIDRYGPTTAEDVLFKGQVWRLVTSQFMHADMNHIFWNMFILWMFGRIVEMQIGTKRFVWLYLLAGMAGGLSECLFDVAMHNMGGDPRIDWLGQGCIGASGGVMAMTIAFALMNPKAPILLFFVLPIPAIWLAVGYFVFETLPLVKALQSGRPSSNIAHAAHLGGMLWALGWAILAGYVRTSWAQSLHGGFGRLARHFHRPPGQRSSAQRRHPVVGGPNAAGGATSRPKSKDEQRLDAILRKIHDEGLMSLSESERKFLKDMSEQKRDDIHFDDNHRRQ